MTRAMANNTKKRKDLNAIVTKLDWDSNFFGFPVAQLTSNRIHENDIDDVFEYCNEHAIRLLQFKCDAHHPESVRLAEKFGFHFADVRMTFTRKLDEKLSCSAFPVNISFRHGIPADVNRLREIVTDIYQHSRYYFDPNFPRDQVQIFYKDWIEKAIHGTFDDFAWIICDSERPVGFCTLKTIDKTTASIGLVGIDKSYTGMNLASIMMQQVLLSLREAGIEFVKVITQGRNYAAQRLYQKNGFLIDSLEIYYHRWFDV